MINDSVPAPSVPDAREDSSLGQPKLELVGFLALALIASF